jgi:hypothetical protein
MDRHGVYGPSEGSPVSRLVLNARALLVAYGVLAAIVGVLVLAGTPARSIDLQGSRQDGIRGAIVVANHGGPPLLRSNGQAAEEGDDPGLYLYLPLISHVFGGTDPLRLLKLLFSSCFFLLLAVYPLLWYEIFSSVAAALLSPVLFLLDFRFLAIHDVYWAPAWCTLLGVPALLAINQRWGPRSLSLLVPTMILGSISSSIRAQAGLPLFLAAAIVVFSRERAWTRRVVSLAVLLLAYMSVSGFAFPAIRHFRDRSVGTALSSQYTASHVFWHPAYLGLGYLPNRFGISWDDTVAVRAAQKVNPRAEYPSAAYERTIRHLYFKILRSDPGYVIHVYLAKAVVVAWDAFRQWWSALFVVPAMLLIPSRMRGRMRMLAALTSPAVVLGAVPPLLGVPFREYELGLLAALGVLWLAGWLWAVSLLPWHRAATVFGAYGVGFFRRRVPLAEKWEDVGSLPPGTRTAAAPIARPYRVCVAIVIAAGLAGFGLSRLADTVRAESLYQVAPATPLVPLPVPHGASMAAWSFNGPPKGWTVLQGVATRLDRRALDVTTTRRRYGYALLSPVLHLAPGAYEIVVHGEVRSGGLAAAALDFARQEFIVTNLYSQQQRSSGTNFGNGRMVVPFSLASNAEVQLVLSNWSPVGRQSHWRLVSASVARQPKPCGCSPPDDNAWLSR